MSLPEVSEPFHAVDVIACKRDGGRLSDEQIDWVIDAFTRGAIPDEQMAALLMAVLWRGLTPGELDRWTAAMVGSGRRLDLAGTGRPTVDKHSTGGVGDGVSLPLVAIVAACGAAVPQLSGRGLGYTGGTLDKMESIPGWRANLSVAEMGAMLRDIGCFIAAPSDDLVPADRRIYALRDVTGTVESIPLIASSIMSKKLAEGTSALVLDVKVGSGTFMPDEASARQLAQTMVWLGAAAGVKTRALLTDMSVPLGRVAGNALEVAQAEALLRGDPEPPWDLRELVIELAREMLEAAGVVADPVAALEDGRAYATWQAMVAAQGGNPLAALPRAAHIDVVRADRSGVVTRLEARGVGVAAWRLGAGRARQQDAIAPGAGVRWHASVGDPVRSGQALFELHTDDPSKVSAARGALQGAVEISDEPGSGGVRRLVIGRVGGGGTVG